MGNKESVDHHILLYGQTQHGKTNFLYDNFLNGKWEEENQKIESSLGYNFELITTLQDQKYGVWDISGHPEFVDLQDLFLKTIPFTGILYALRPQYFEGQLQEERLKEIGTARAHIHYLANHRHFLNKFFLVILNIEESQLVSKNSDEDPTPEQLEMVIDEMKELLKFSTIPTAQKGILIMDRGTNYTKLWEKVGTLVQQIKANEKKKEKADKAEKNEKTE